MAFDFLNKLTNKRTSLVSPRSMQSIRSRNEEEHSEMLRLSVPRLFDDQSDKVTLQYQNCLNRIAAYQQSLLKELEKFEIDANHNKFVEHFQEIIIETKNNLEQQNNHLKKCHKLVSINQHLLSRLDSKEQLLKLYKLLNQVAEESKSLTPIYDIVHRDYKKLPIDTLLGYLGHIRKTYYQIVNNMNIVIRSGAQPNSPIYQFLYRQCEEWKGKLAELYEDVFIWSFDFIKWPKIALEDVNAFEKATPKQKTLFTNLFCSLLELQIGKFKLDGNAIPDNKLCNLELFHQPENKIPVHLPIKLMTLPLIKRFNFHFLTENSKLNNIENPEWYLCQVEQWITRNELFLNNTIDPILEEYFEDQCKNAKFQLTCLLLELVKAKLRHDATKLDEDRLFSLTLDEVIIFNKQINFLVPGIFEINPKLNPIHELFNDEEYFQRFILLEKNRLNEFVDSIFESDTSWNVVYGNDYTEDNRFVICEAADKFSLLLQNLIERSTFIPLDKYQLRIIYLIIDTIDDFCLRLSQIVHVIEERWPFTKKFYSILNTFGFLLTLVNEWKNNSYILHILSTNKKDLSIFQNTVRTFEHMIEEIFERIENNIIADVTLDIIEYKKLNWHSMSVDLKHLNTSKIGATLIYNISVKNSTLKKAISSNLFHSFLYDIADKIQNLFFDRIIMEHYFNTDGARQLQHDIQNGLFSIFSLYIKNTEYTFSKLSDALLILNCSPVTCHNLQERFKCNTEIEFKQALRNIGVYSLKPSTVILVIEKRIGFN